VQAGGLSFLKYLDRFKNLISQCPHHCLDQGRLCKIIYEGIDQQNRAKVESLYQGQFLSYNLSDA